MCAQVSGKSKNREGVRSASIIGKEVEKEEGGERFMDEEQDVRV